MNAIAPEMLQSRVRDLPALPQVVGELLAALRRDDVAVDQLALKIAHDQALAAKTLRLANCSFYGVPGRVSTIRDAINILGVRSLACAMTAAAVAGSFAPTHCEGFDFAAYWSHSIATALSAQAIARAAGLDENAAFTAGLLHDIGRLALASRFPEAMSRVVARRHADDTQMQAAEQAELGIDHAQIGASIAHHWHFATPVIDAIRRHHQPAEGGSATLIDVVHVADNVAHALDLSGDADELVPPLSIASWQRLGLTPEQCQQIFEQTEEQLSGLREALTV